MCISFLDYLTSGTIWSQNFIFHFIFPSQKEMFGNENHRSNCVWPISNFHFTIAYMCVFDPYSIIISCVKFFVNFTESSDPIASFNLQLSIKLSKHSHFFHECFGPSIPFKYGRLWTYFMLFLAFEKGLNSSNLSFWTYSVFKCSQFLKMIYACAGGLTENDFILAAKINGLDLQRLLRRKAATWSIQLFPVYMNFSLGY